MEALKVANADLVIHVHPSKSQRVTEAVLTELSSLLFKFNETFDGVVLAYDPSSWDTTARVRPGVNPYLGVGLSAKLLLFSPKPNMLVEGEVVKVTQQSIHLVVLGFSSAVIMEEDMQDRFKYKFKDGKEIFMSQQHKKHRIEIGEYLRFAVKSFDEEILHICGSLEPAHTGKVQWLEKNSEKWAQTESSKKAS